MGMTHTEFMFFNNDLTRLGYNPNVVEVRYNKSLNKVGSCIVKIPRSLDNISQFDKLSQPDLGMIILVSTHSSPISKIDLDAYWLSVEFRHDIKNEVFIIEFEDAMGLLNRRGVIYPEDEPIGTYPQSRIDEPGNVAMKRVFDEHIGKDAGVRSLFPNVYSAPISIPSPVVYSEIQFKSLYSVMRDVCRMTKEKGTDLYFDVVITDPVKLEFRTYINSRGTDYTTGNKQTIIRSNDNNFIPKHYILNWEQDNVAYIAGRGKGNNRVLTEVIGKDVPNSIFWRREVFNTSSSADYDSILDEGKTLVSEIPRSSLSGSIIGTRALSLNLGDKVFVEHFNDLIESVIDSVRVTYSAKGYDRTLTVKAV
jgi:hypothetical protein